MRIVSVLASAALSGAAGLALEVVCLSTAGLALGYARAAAFGLAAWIGGWAVGARLGARPSARPLLAPAVGVALASLAVPALLLELGTRALPRGVGLAAGTAALALAAVPQGVFLPRLARGLRARDVSGLFAANLAGALAGAWLVGYRLVGSAGLLPAAWTAGGLALAAAAVGGIAVDPRRAERGAGGVGRAGEDASGARGGHARAALLIAVATAWGVGLEWVLLRLGVLWLGGMQSALAAVLGASLAALALGAAVLPRIVPRDARGVAVVIALALAGTLWPLVAHVVLGPLTERRAPVWLLAACLVGPALVPFGALVPVVHRTLRGESGRVLGRLLLHEAWGAALGLPLLHWTLVPRLGLGGTLGVLAGAGGAVGALVALRVTPRAAVALLAGAAVAATIALRARPPALESPQLANPAFRVLAFEEDAAFAVTVVDDGLRAERTLLTDDFRATATGDDYLYMRVLAHLPLLLHPSPKRVCVLAFGTGTTAGAVAVHPEVERIDVLEISRAVCEQAPWFREANRGVFDEGLPGLLDDADARARVVLELGDGRALLARHPLEYDVITMEPLLPNSPYAVYLYTPGFYTRARRALAPGGLVCQWVPPHALASEAFDAVVAAFTSSFAWSGVFAYGGQVVLVGGEAAPRLRPERFPAPGSEPASALAAVGLATPEGLAARFVVPGDGWPAVRRPLTDADPWIVYGERGRGKERLADLPENLARLASLARAMPARWADVVGERGLELAEGARWLDRAREQRARELAASAGVLEADRFALPVETSLAEARRRLTGDPELAAFERSLRLEAARTQGVLALASGRLEDATRSLLDAVALAPARADLHLFLAVALEAAGDRAHAVSAATRALELCPRVMETPPGRLAAQLGAVEEILERARERVGGV